ncbi:hypothetical protein ABTZ98_02640 [Streptomyces bacillaris]
MLKRDINRLQSLKVRRAAVSAKSVEDVYYLVYSSTQPRLGIARTQRTASDSPADQLRWEVWIATRTMSPHGFTALLVGASALWGVVGTLYEPVGRHEVRPRPGEPRLIPYGADADVLRWALASLLVRDLTDLEETDLGRLRETR